MKPRGYLHFITRKWDLIAELFEINRQGPIDQATLVQTIGYHHPKGDTSALIERLLSYEVITRLFTGQTLYNLGFLTEQIVEHLLDEQQLGLSESILVHLELFDKLSAGLLAAVEDRDLDRMIRGIKKINKQTQTVKRQALHNYKAIQNIVGESKKISTIIPLKQRYADVLETWENYITPMAKMIDPWGAFDSNTDNVIVRLDRAGDILEAAGALISERENIRRAKHMIVDMKANLIETFSLSRALLQPLYEIARLNSKVTSSTSIILEYARKNNFKAIEEIASLDWFFKERSPLVSNDTGLITYYAGFKDIQENSAPPILILGEEEKSSEASKLLPPLNRYAVLDEIKSDLPIANAIQWAIDQYPDFSTGKILDIILLMMTEKSLAVQKDEQQSFQTKTHVIQGFTLKVEKKVEKHV